MIRISANISSLWPSKLLAYRVRHCNISSRRLVGRTERTAPLHAADAMLPYATFMIETDEAGHLSAPIR